MTDESKIKRARIISCITTWTLRLTFAITIIFILGVLFAAMLSGNGDMQRKSLENVFAALLGHPVRIGTLNHYELLPTMRMNLENLVALEDGEKPVLILEKLNYAHDPLTAYAGGHALITAQFENLLTKPGLVGPYSLHLRHGELNEKGFMATGDYGGYDTQLTIPVTTVGGGASPRYRIAVDQPITVKIGDIHLTFRANITKTHVILSPLTMAVHDAVVTGAMTVPRAGNPDPIHLRFENAQGAPMTEGEIASFGAEVTMKLQPTSEIDATSAHNIDQVLMSWLNMLGTPQQKNEHGALLKVPDIRLHIGDQCVFSADNLKVGGKHMSIANCLTALK